MSFIDLAAMTFHRRNEMEARIQILVNKCDQAINDIVRMKTQAQGFVQVLNCEPSILKERFLNCMKQLDEYIYLITDFNLAVGNFENEGHNFNTVAHNPSKQLAAPLQPEIVKTQSEPTASTSKATNHCSQYKPTSRKMSQEEQSLIQFSSSSCSDESVPVRKMEPSKTENPGQLQLSNLINDMRELTTVDVKQEDTSEGQDLPQQSILQTDHKYEAEILHVDGSTFYIRTETANEAVQMTRNMTLLYRSLNFNLRLEDVASLTYCAYLDEYTDHYARGMVISVEESKKEVQVFLVDTGEFRRCPHTSIRPLAAEFCCQAPFARNCHLAGIELQTDSEEVMKKYEILMRHYMKARLTVVVEDNSSESLGVYVYLSTRETLNELIIKFGLATPIDVPRPPETQYLTPTRGPPGFVTTDDDDSPIRGPPGFICSGNEQPSQGPPGFQPSNTNPPLCGPPEFMSPEEDLERECPEYEDPVEAVAGYSCRDEADICKHYKGGPDKTCFKGSRCKKKHILKHPHGWTLDKVEALTCPPLPLPVPGTWVRLRITCVPHFNRFYAHIVTDENLPSTRSQFGVLLPPETLDQLIVDMNSPATILAYKPLQMTPATSELVAANFPLDGQWYRAVVQSVVPVANNVEIMYVDYGNVCWVRDDALRVLEPRYAELPAQALPCVLAGVKQRSQDCQQWKKATQFLTNLTLDKIFDAYVIARSYQEVTVELVNAQGMSIAQLLADAELVNLSDYEVIEDNNVAQKYIAP